MISITIDCTNPNCGFRAFGGVGIIRRPIPISFDDAIRRATTHAEKTGHFLSFNGTIKPDKQDTVEP